MKRYDQEKYLSWRTIDVKKDKPYTQCVGHPESNDFPFRSGEVVLYLGPVTNMPGHVVIACQSGAVTWGYHPTCLHVIPQEEA